MTERIGLVYVKIETNLLIVQVRSMPKTQSDNAVIDCISLVYIETKIEL